MCLIELLVFYGTENEILCFMRQCVFWDCCNYVFLFEYMYVLFGVQILFLFKNYFYGSI